MMEVENEPEPIGIQERMARLRLAQMNSSLQLHQPVKPSSPTTTATSQFQFQRAPPLPPSRPKPGNRASSISLPVREPYQSASENSVCNQPWSEDQNVAQKSKPKPILPPRLPPRRTTLEQTLEEESESNNEIVSRRGNISRLPPPLPPNNHIRSTSPSASSVFSNSSIETLDTSVSDFSPKLPPRVPSRNNLSNRNSFSQKITQAPLIRRSLPPADDALPEIKAWNQPTESSSRRPSYGSSRKASVSSISSIETDRGRPELPNRVSSGSSGILPPPIIIKSKSPQPPQRPVSVRFGSNKQNVVDITEMSTKTYEIRPPPAHRKNILNMGFGGAQGKLPSPPKTPEPEPTQGPPPIPVGSRPTLNMTTKPTGRSLSDTPPALPSNRPRLTGNSNGLPSTCLTCRDFSRPDQHAAMFPRQNWTDVSQLAHALTSPFPSATDKARAIFTWHHHNISYDTYAFFNNCVKSSTPASTLHSGWAVCEGYAGLFVAMALAVGMEAMVVNGHGKGYGYTPSADGSIPPYDANHAWAAVKIDGGEWHLTDPCWGAGSLCDATKLYKAKFSPKHFTQSSEQFRKRHFPDNPEYQFTDKKLTWDEYILQPEGPLLYGNFTDPDIDYSPNTIEPYCKTMQPHTQYWIRITRSCPHVSDYKWVVLAQTSRDDRMNILREDGRGGLVCEIVSGASGSNVQLAHVTQFDGKDAKGLGIKEYESKAARSGASWSYLANWEVL